MGGYDATMKSMAETAMLNFLRVTGILPSGAEVSVVQEERELVPPQKAVDSLYRLDGSGESWLVIVEFLARWHSREEERIAERAATVTLMPSHKPLAIRPWVVLLTDRDVPAELPQVFWLDRRWTKSLTIPAYVKLYEMDPAETLDLGDPEVAALALLMRSDMAALEQAGTLVVATGDERLLSEFVTLGSLRYDREWLRNLLGRCGMHPWWNPKVVSETPIGRAIREEAAAEGKAEGKAEGLLEGKVQAMREYLAARFPNLNASREIAAIRTEQQAGTILVRLYSAHDEGEALAAFRG